MSTKDILLTLNLSEGVDEPMLQQMARLTSIWGHPVPLAISGVPFEFAYYLKQQHSHLIGSPSLKKILHDLEPKLTTFNFAADVMAMFDLKAFDMGPQIFSFTRDSIPAEVRPLVGEATKKLFSLYDIFHVSNIASALEITGGKNTEFASRRFGN